MSTTDILDLVKKVKSEMPAGAFSPVEGKSLVYDQQQGSETADPSSLTPEARDVLRLVEKVKQGSVAVESKAAGSSIDSQLSPKYDGREAERIADEAAAAKGKENIAKRSEFTRGLLRGIDQTQATFYGGLGMLSSAMGDDKASDMRFQQYREQMRQASENPATVDEFFSTDPKKGAFGSVGNLGTYVAGTMGSLLPTIAESAVAGLAGAAIGGAIVPAPDPTDVVAVPVGFIGGVLSRGAMKKAIAETAERYVARGVAAEAAQQMGERAVKNALAKRIGATIGTSQITALQEGGGMYAEGREAGYDNPWSAILLGQVSGASEGVLGNVPFALRTFIGKTAVREAAQKFGTKEAAGLLWDAVKNAGEEAVQESFQEFLGDVNSRINDPNQKIFTKENFKQWAESGAAGALAGGILGGGGVATQAALDARRRQLEELRAKGFISKEEAKDNGIEGNTRREIMGNAEQELADLNDVDALAKQESDRNFANQQQQQAQSPQPQVGVQPEQFAEVPIPEDGGMTDEEYAAFRQAQMGVQGGNVSTPPPTGTPTVPPVTPQPTVQPPQIQPQQQAAVQPSQAPGTIEPTDISKAIDTLGKGLADGLYIKIWNDVQSGSLQKMDKPPLFEQLVLRGYNGGVVRSLEDVRSIQDGMTGDFETDKVVGVNNLNKLASKYQGQQPAAGQPPVAPPLPAITPEQQIQSDKEFAEQKAAEQGPVAPQVPVITSPEEHASLPMFGVYERTFQGQKRYGVKGSDRGGFGDSLFGSPEAAQAESDRRFASSKDQERKSEESKKKAEEATKKQADYEASFGGFLSTDPMTKGRQLKVLGKPVQSDGKATTIKDIIEQRVASGWIVNDAGQLESPDKQFVLTAGKITKTGMDYARRLIANKAQPATETEAAPQPESKPTDQPAPSAMEFNVGQGARPIPGMEGDEANYTVLKRKPDVIPDTVKVVISGRPGGKGWISVDGTGMTGPEAYDRAMRKYESKRPGPSRDKTRKEAIRKAIEEQGGFDANSSDDMEAIRNKLYDGADTPTGTEIRAVMDDMRVEAGRKLESEQQKPTEPTDATTAPTEPQTEQPQQSEGVDAALKALDAMLASEKPKEPPKPRSVRKEPQKTKQGQYVLPLMPGMAAEIDRQDFVRRYRDRALEPLWGWSSKEEDAEGIQATIDTLAPIYSEIFNDIYAGKRETIDDVYDSEPYERILKLDDDAIAVGDALMINRLDEQIKAALQDYPKKEAKRPPRKSEQTLKEAKSDMQAAHDAAQALMDKIRGKLMSGVDPEISAEVVRVAYLYTKAGVKTFKGYVEAVVEQFGEAFAREFAPYMQDGWTALNIRGLVSDPTGKVDDYLAKETTDEEQQGERGTDQDLPMGDGTGEPQGDGARGDTANDAERDSQKGTRQEGDQVLPTDGETTGVDGRGGSKGDGADGGVDTNQPEQGPTDGADAGGGVADGAMEERLAVNHVISSDDDLAVASVTESLKRNIKALQILKKLEADGRFPDESERKSLAQYTGWGGLSQALDSIKGERMLQESWGRDENWEKKWGASYVKLKELLTKEELQAAQSSTENAHYTSKEIIQSLWKIAERLGYTGGRVLELGAGVGHFAGLVPAQFRGVTQFTMVEMDSISSRIAKMLYPTHDVIAGDMQQFKAVPGSVTIGIGNVPFAGGTVPDSNKRYGEPLNLHNYSIARHLDALAPGGVVVVISSHNTLDSNIKQRKFLASKGELIGAIRLPNDAFASNAKTEVVTDILVFRRPRQGDPSLGTRFDQNADIAVKNKDGKDVAKQINRYFADNPEMVLGVHSAKGSMYTADEYTVESTPGDLQDKINAAIEKLPRDILGTVSVAESVVAANASIPFGRLEIRDGVVVMGYGDTFTPIAGKTFEGFPADLTGKTGLARAKDFITLRESLASARETMLSEDASDEDVKKAQRKLNDAYDKYVKKHGNLSERKTSIFKRDPDYYRVLSLENETGEYDPASKKIVITYNKAAIFTERVLGPQKEPTSAATPADAMSVSLAWKGAIDSVYIGRLLGLDASKAEAKLIEERLAFRNPATTQLEMSDLYLSGNVRSKLEQAKIIAEEDPQYQRNVDALEKVMPEPVTLKKDTVRLGATWIPENVVAAFATQAFGTNTGVSYNANTDSWTVGDPYDISETARARYQTERIRPNEILAELLNLRSIKVFDKVETGEYDTSGRAKTTQVLNEKETQAAKHRASVMRADFEKWVLENREVSQVLAKIYNDKYNNFVRAKYNGDFLTLPGSNPEVKLRPYQKDAIWRIINRGTALLAHAVGSGKTYTMIGAAMEMRRLGIARRPLLVVQNATLGQFATSFQKMYPNAKVLVATKDDLGKGKRQLFLNKISTGNWDAVVMAQSTLDNMASEERVERAFIQDQIDLLEEAIREEGGAFAKTPTVKQLARQKKSLQDRFDKLMGSRAKKEDNVVFEDLGVDALFLDEAHAYKKPTFATKLSNLVGLNTESSAKSLATMIKVRSVQSANNGRNVILATGTPVTNTLGEAWHMVNYVSPATNAAFNARTFDQFISNFAMVEPTLTMNAGGQYVYKDAIVKFRNGRQLVEHINESWDIVTPEHLRAYMENNKKGFPVLRNGKLTAITVERTPGVASFMGFIERVYSRYKSLPAKERRALSFIPALAYGASKAATLDIRLVMPNAAEEKNSKLQRAAEEVKRIYDETSDSQGTQLFFSDTKNPYSMDRLNQFMSGEAIDAFEVDSQVEGDVVAVEEQSDSDSFLYQELKRKLLAMGVPSEQIAFISDATTDAKRQALFQRVNNGDVRVLIGSTSKMGVGVNVQQKLAAIHHFDTPWLPADLEQREGRILRFGNENEVVEVLRYAMKKTLDGAIYMGTSRKQKFIWQVLNGQIDSDTFDDPSSASMLSIEEQLAAIQDDPVFFEKIEVQNRLRELELERQSFFDAQQRVAESLRNTESDLRYRRNIVLPQLMERLDRIKEVRSRIEDAGGSLDAFTAKIDGKDYTDPKKADEVIKAKLEDSRRHVGENFNKLQTIDKAGGILSLSGKQLIKFTVGPANVAIGLEPAYLQEKNDEGKDTTRAVARVNSIAYLIEPRGDYIFYAGNATVPATFFEKMGLVPKTVQSEIAGSEERIVAYEAKISELKALLDKQWEDESEYQEKRSRLSEIETLMLSSGSSLSEKKSDATTEEDQDGESDLDNGLRNPPPLLMQTEPDIYAGFRSKAMNLGLAAEKAGITAFEDFVAHSVKTIGTDETYKLGAYLRRVGEIVGMTGIRPVKDILGVPMTREEYVQLGKETFASVPAEQVEAGIEVAMLTGLPPMAAGFAPAGSPVPGQGLMQGDFDQPADYEFTESDYRPAVVSYARNKWGSAVAANGKPTWQNFVRWFDDSAVVDKDGNPLVVYHGGARTIDDNIIRTPFFYMTANRSEAEYWAGEDGRIHEVYLKFTKPYRDSQHDDRFMDMTDRADFEEREMDDPEFAERLREATREAVDRMNELKKQGYNSIVMQGEADEDYDNFIAFDSTQIKSATGNRGTFDPNNPNMLMQRQSQGGNVKGWTKFISGTRALIGATSKADISTVIHEYAHVIRRFLLDRDVPQDQRIDITDVEIEMLEKKCGAGSVIDGKWVTKWDVPSEEKFAKMWEQYFFEGESPNALLDSLFAKISRWMQQVYQTAMSITGGTLDPEVRKLFDKMVQRQLPADQRTGTKSRDGGAPPVPTERQATQQADDDNLTSVANAYALETRMILGLPGFADVTKETFQEWIDQALQILRKDPTYGNRLVKELAQSNRNIDKIETAVLELHLRSLKNLSDAAADRLFAAVDAKDDVAAVQARRESDLLINEIEEVTDVTNRVGTEQGRSLAARKIVLRSDFTLAGLRRTARVANAGQPLNEEQSKQIEELAKQIAKLEGDLAKEIQEKDDLARQLAAKESIDDTQKEVGKPVRNTATNRAVKKVESFVSKFVNIFGKRDDTTTLQQTEDEAMAEDGEDVIKSFVEAGVYSFGEFMSKFKAVIKGDVPIAARAALRKAWEKLKAQGDIPAPEMSDERQTTELRRLAKMVERNLVEFGITDPEEVIDGVHEALQEVFEDVTRREAMDAMSGYGQYSTPSQEPNDKIIRDLNAQFQQMAKLDDMKQGIAPKKSGRGRDEPSPDLRELIREVNEMKRNSKYFVTDPEAQLKTIFQATRTALRNRIYDLNKAIKTKEPIPGRTPNAFEGEQAKEIESLRKQRDELMATYKATFPKPGLTFEQRAAIAERALDREITKIEQQLASGNVAAKERAEPVSTPAIKDKQNRLESLRAQREAVREMQMTDADREQRAERLERQAEKAYVANLLNRIADFEDRKAQGYFGPKPKKEPRALSPREIELSRQLVNLKDEFFRYAAEYRLKNMSKVERFWDRTKETMHLSRAIMTSFDLSAVFRQGGIASLAHPRLAAAASREMLAALRRGDGEFNTMDKISKDKLYALAMRAGLSITTDSGKITRQEEAYMGRWAKWGIGKKGTKINELSLKALFFVAPSARAYTTFLNSMRFRVFKYMVSNLSAGGEVTIDEAKVIASYVNAATGRAELGKFNQAAANLNTVFFAPRYVASRFQYLAMPFYLLPSTKVSGRVKKMIAMEYARHAMGLAAFLGLSVALASLLTDDEEEKPTVEFDPRSSDFMKLKIGDTRIDPMAGLSQTVTLIGQMATGQKKGLRGDIKDLYGENRKFGDPDLWEVGTGFLRKKLAPIPGAIVDLRVGENVIGEKETVLSATTDLFVPLSFQEAGETMKARGLVGGAVVTALSLLGMGGGTYGPKTQYATADTAKREELFSKDLENVKWNDPDLAYKDFLTTAQLDKFNKQREGRKQSLVFSAAADPKRKDYNSDETFKKSVEERDKALEAVIKAGMGPKETQLLLIAYFKRNYGSAYEVRGGVYQMKESLANRLRTIRRKLNEKKTTAK